MHRPIISQNLVASKRSPTTFCILPNHRRKDLGLYDAWHSKEQTEHSRIQRVKEETNVLVTKWKRFGPLAHAQSSTSTVMPSLEHSQFCHISHCAVVCESSNMEPYDENTALENQFKHCILIKHYQIMYHKNIIGKIMSTKCLSDGIQRELGFFFVIVKVLPL